MSPIRPAPRCRRCIWRSELFGVTFKLAATVHHLDRLEAGSLPLEHRELAEQFVAFLLSEGQQIIRNQSDLIPMLPVPKLEGLSPADVAQMPGTYPPNGSGPGLLTYLD